MLEKIVRKLNDKFLLTAEQKIALFEAKVARAEAQVQELAELANALKRVNLR